MDQVIILMGVLAGCKQNPVFEISPGDFNELVRLSEYRSAAGPCADYYIRKERLKITRLSMVCAEFTRDIKKLAETRGLINKTKVENYRDAKVWERWRSLNKETLYKKRYRRR